MSSLASSQDKESKQRYEHKKEDSLVHSSIEYENNVSNESLSQDTISFLIDYCLISVEKLQT